MTPTRLQEIRQRAEAFKATLGVNRSVDDVQTAEMEFRLNVVGDLFVLLTLWDTHQTALRALVEDWKREAGEIRFVSTDPALRSASRGMLEQNALSMEQCAAELERLLTPEQS